MTSEYSKHYQAEVSRLQSQRLLDYHNKLESFSKDAIKTARLLANSPDPQFTQSLLQALELDWLDLQKLKEML